MARGFYRRRTRKFLEEEVFRLDMSAAVCGITVDAVREQLKLLGHHDVPDEVIMQFLDDLQVEVPNLANVVSPVKSNEPGPSYPESARIQAYASTTQTISEKDCSVQSTTSQVLEPSIQNFASAQSVQPRPQDQGQPATWSLEFEPAYLAHTTEGHSRCVNYFWVSLLVRKGIP